MGILDGLLGLNTTDATNAATQAANAGLSSTAQSNAQELINAATAAGGALNTGATGATSAINSGYGAGIGALTGYAGQAQGTLTNGINTAANTVQSSNSNYAPYTANGGAASGMLSNALGLNGAAGNTAATGAFQAAPGYQYQVDQATGAAQRAAAAAGMNASGNTLQAVTQLGSNLANQGYNTWLSNLQNTGAQGLTAAAGVSGNNQTAGALQGAGATTGANLSQQTGTNLGILNSGQGTANANIQSNLGTGLAGIQTGLGNATVANNWTGTLGINQNNLADAKAQDNAASQNNGIFSSLAKNVVGAGLSFFPQQTSSL